MNKLLLVFLLLAFVVTLTNAATNFRKTTHQYPPGFNICKMDGLACQYHMDCCDDLKCISSICKYPPGTAVTIIGPTGH